MKIEVRCPTCSKGYLIDEASIPRSGGTLPCISCGNAILIPARDAPSAAEPAPAPPLRSTPSTVRRVRPPADVPAALAAPVVADVICPRCGLHFHPASATAEHDASERRVVLVVEDMEYFQQIAKDALSGRYDVRPAKSVDDALAMLARGGIDLVLLDLVLEHGEDGLRLLRELPSKPCPVLIFTAQDESEMYGESWDRFMKLGADDAIIKGMNMGDLLVRKVAALLGESEPENGPTS